MKKDCNPLRFVPYVLGLMLFVGTAFCQLIWQKHYGAGDPSKGNSVQQTTDEGYIVVGYATPTGGYGAQVYLIKTDSLGDTLWTRTHGGAGDEYGNSVQQTTDEGYIIAGTTSSFGNSFQVFLIKTDSLGDTLWTRTYGGAGDEYGNSVQQTTDGGYIIAGSAQFMTAWLVYLIKTDAYGNGGIEEHPYSLHLSYTPHTAAFPNPFSSFTTVIGYENKHFILYDISGKKVGSCFGHRIGFGLPAGIYFLIPEDKSFNPIRVVKVE